MSNIEIRAKREPDGSYTGCAFLDGLQLLFEQYGFFKADCETVLAVFKKLNSDFDGIHMRAAIELQDCLWSEMHGGDIGLCASLPANSYPGVRVSSENTEIADSAIAVFDHAYIGTHDAEVQWMVSVQMPANIRLSVGTTYKIAVPSFTDANVRVMSADPITPGLYHCHGLGAPPRA